MRAEYGFDSDVGWGVLMVLIPAALVFIGVRVRRGAERTRLEELRSVARRLGLRHVASMGSQSVPPSLAECREPIEGEQALEGHHDGGEVSVFDYDIRSGGSRPFAQTVVTVRVEGRAVPPFLLTPASFADKLAATMGGQDLDFAEDPEFSGACRLRGDEPAVRALFDPALRARLRTLLLPHRLHLEGWGSRLAIWSPGNVLKPEPLVERLRLAAQVSRAFGR